MNMSQKQYGEYIKQKSKNSPLLKNMLFAFLIGGAICTAGQGILELYKNTLGMGKEDAASAVSITMVFLGAFFTGVGLYGKLAKVAGAGTLVPITGFSNAIVSPAMEYKSEGLVMGIGAKMFTIAGPVLVYGITASVIYGLILCIFQ